jgi:hypothetical protein
VQDRTKDERCAHDPKGSAAPVADKQE